MSLYRTESASISSAFASKRSERIMPSLIKYFRAASIHFRVSINPAPLKSAPPKRCCIQGFFSDAFKKGDKIRLEYITGKGLKVYKNNVYKGIVPGLEFKNALFSIWLGTKPADASLKNKMLGKA
jgi:hypothetical protein